MDDIGQYVVAQEVAIVGKNPGDFVSVHENFDDRNFVENTRSVGNWTPSSSKSHSESRNQDYSGFDLFYSKNGGSSSVRTEQEEL